MQKIFAWVRERPWVSTLLGASLVAVVGGLFEYFMTGGEAGWIPLGAGVVGAFVMAVWIALVGKSEPQTPEPVQMRIVGSGGVAVALRESEPSQRVFSPRSPSELVALRKGKTEIVARAAIKPHIGTWLPYQGPVVDVKFHYSGEGMVISLEHSSVDAPRIYAWFGPSWSKSIEILDIGDQVTLVGEISDILSNLIALEKCELR